jgi:predicted nucleic acid-binding protein
LTAIVDGIVIDASVALAWCFPDEASDYADGVLAELENRTAIVPSICSVEFTNAPLVGERRKRIQQPEVRRYVELLKGLNIVEDGQPFAETVSNILPLAREHDLSAYDAAYPFLTEHRL